MCAYIDIDNVEDFQVFSLPYYVSQHPVYAFSQFSLPHAVAASCCFFFCCCCCCCFLSSASSPPGTNDVFFNCRRHERSNLHYYYQNLFIAHKSSRKKLSLRPVSNSNLLHRFLGSRRKRYISFRKMFIQRLFFYCAVAQKFYRRNFRGDGKINRVLDCRNLWVNIKKSFAEWKKE